MKPVPWAAPGRDRSVLSSILLSPWNLEVEDWNEGEKKTITEDHGNGVIIQEIYYETRKTIIPVGETELKPWKDISALGPEVSGIGYYTSAFSLPPDWTNNATIAELYIGSTCGNSAAVYINGVKAPPYDFNRKTLDITALLKAGENIVKIEVPSTLNNRLLTRNYHAAIDRMLQARAVHVLPPPRYGRPGVQDYGLIGPVMVKFYRTIHPCNNPE
ncbi:MAG: hypothetical protein LBG57_05615 [Treponema sp.]|nr:hypothetical protein [Treponema sp.]